MSDPNDTPPRFDLRPLAPDAIESERIVSGVMARLASYPQQARARPDVLEIIGGSFASRPVWIAAAAAIVAIAGVAMLTVTPNDSAPAGSVSTLIATWADRQHVPTNGELLYAFQGYGQ